MFFYLPRLVPACLVDFTYNSSSPRTYHVGTGALKGPLRAYCMSTWAFELCFGNVRWESEAYLERPD